MCALAGQSEETLVNHPDQSESAIVAFMIEAELRSMGLEANKKK